MVSSQPVPLDPESQLAAKLQAIEERLRALETAPRITSTSQRGGSYQLLDDEGNLVWTFGEYTRGAVTDYGIQAIVPDGAGPGSGPTALEINGNGMEAPHIPLTIVKEGDFAVVTSGSFVSVWTAVTTLLVSDSLVWSCLIGCDAATTAEAKLVASGGVATDVISCPASTFTAVDFEWLHGQDLGAGFSVSLQVRRTSGAGNVNVYAPTKASQAGSAGMGSTSGGT